MAPRPSIRKLEGVPRTRSFITIFATGVAAVVVLASRRMECGAHLRGQSALKGRVSCGLREEFQFVPRRTTAIHSRGGRSRRFCNNQTQQLERVVAGAKERSVPGRNKREVSNIPKKQLRSHFNMENSTIHTPSQKLRQKLLVVCGPSAVGKGTLMSRIRQRYSENNRLTVAVSHTTRAPRSGEVDGEDYYFVNPEEFSLLVKDGAFIEHAGIHGNQYGTTKRAIEEALGSDGQNICVLEIDVEGAQSVARTCCAEDVRYVFITSSGGFQTLQERLRGRGTESESKIQRRLATAEQELSFVEQNPTFFDMVSMCTHIVVVNDVLEDAVEQIDRAIQDWFINSKT
eukprot:jgi/Bigna1/68034/fgenesh1_pg.5_\